MFLCIRMGVGNAHVAVTVSSFLLFQVAFIFGVTRNKTLKEKRSEEYYPTCTRATRHNTTQSNNGNCTPPDKHKMTQSGKEGSSGHVS